MSSKAEADKNFFVMSGDHGYALFDEIRRKAPDQFINTRVNEQAMVGAAGMAKTGKKMVIHGLTSFIPIRELEFIKMNICYERLPVIILGDGAGTVYITLGASHQCGEGVTPLRTLPVKIYSPVDRHEMEICLNQAFTENMPTSIRIGKSDKPAVQTNDSKPALSAATPVHTLNSTTAVFATGSMVSTGLEITKKYNLSIYSYPVLSFYSHDEMLSALNKYKPVVVLEEHSVHGGLGSAIADHISENNLGLETISLKDVVVTSTLLNSTS